LTKKNAKNNIREVWSSNFDEELLYLMKAIKKAKYIAMDTEFPGTVFRTSDQNHGDNF